MDIINHAGIPPDLVARVASEAELPSRNILLFLDDQENHTRRDRAREKVEGNRKRGWEVYPWDVQELEKDKDYHAWFCISELLQYQVVPEHVKESVSYHDSLIYLDATNLKGHRVLSVISIAHECRHAWQYYTSPLTYFGNIVLSWVMEPQLTPVEHDAEIFAKRLSMEILGSEAVSKYVEDQILSGPQEHREMWRRFATINSGQDHSVSEETRIALLENTRKLRETQEELQIDIPQLARVASLLSMSDGAKFLAETAKRH